MKKKVVSLCLVALLAMGALIGGTMAYFTDEDSETNVFTVRNVDIELLESQLHRVNAGVANGQTSTSPLWSNDDMEGTAKKYADGNTYWTGACYSDAQIEEDAETYQSNYLKDADIAPGTGYHKMPYVKNTGKNPAYIRIRVMIPAELDSLLDDSMYTSSALEREFTSNFKKTKTVDNIVYKVYEFTRLNPLAPGEMTFWNVWGTITMDTNVTNDNIADAKEDGLIDNEGKFKVLVEADAIQAAGFNSAEAAFAAFDASAADAE